MVLQSLRGWIPSDIKWLFLPPSSVFLSPSGMERSKSWLVGAYFGGSVAPSRCSTPACCTARQVGSFLEVTPSRRRPNGRYDSTPPGRCPP
ncbi:hypothetical protein LX32DRAFT_135690 [Colletotrichum zoysiae]|uniref:Uncharacterized protein n=1 Tax=Colletotrichum zoysiae TaxID=1216348 RepID=A0AAD9H878_9PEZI|nr:hypothetical protein LX32DRAFT_135690 [Colletotrichum zoysiae]